MSQNQRPHIAFWGPLPPDGSGVAGYNASLLPELAKRCLLEVFTVQPQAIRREGAFPVYPLERYTAQAIRQPFDLNIYQLSNAFAYGTPYYQQLLRRPGLSVFHDLSLFDMYWGLYWRDGYHDQFWQTVDHSGGSEMRTLLQAELDERARLNRPIDRRRYPMLRRAAEYSLGAIVHSGWAAEQLRTLRPTMPIIQTELGADLIDSEAGQRFRASQGWANDDLVIGVLGRISTTTRPEATIAAFNAIHVRFPGSRLLIAGYESLVSDYVRAIRDRIADAGLGDAIFFPSDVSDKSFQTYLQAADVIAALRSPNAGGSSAVMLRAFGAGKCVIASDEPQFRDYNPAFCWRVSTDPQAEADALIDRLSYAADHLEEVRAAGQQAAEFVRQHATWPIVADRYLEAIDQLLTARHTVQTTLPELAEAVPDQPESPVPGVQFIGDLNAASGLSEARLTMLNALLAARVPVRVHTLKTPLAAQYPQADDRLSALQSHYQWSDRTDDPITILYANIHEINQLRDKKLWHLVTDQYTIAVWIWELEQLDRRTYPYVGQANEIWVASRFAAQSFSKVSGVPIRVIPIPVELSASTHVSRAEFGLPDNRMIYFFHFSALSTDSRKNPWAVIEAFRKAFGKSDTDGPLLVLKVHHLEDNPELQRDLRAAIEAIGGILIEDNYTRQQTTDLISCIDVYVSLHRSEGFGLGMAEAMALGKPVIATDYSSNTDFLTAENGYPVRYTLRFIETHDHRYRPLAIHLYSLGQLWAEADTDHAAHWMSVLYSDPTAGQIIGQRAAESIRRFCSPAVVGQLMKQRLMAINRTLPTKR